jgi:hypothetical protein
MNDVEGVKREHGRIVPDTVCETLKNKFSDEFKFMINLQNASRQENLVLKENYAWRGTEQGVTICEKDGKLSLSEKTFGEETHVTTHDCPVGTNEIGVFHTHPLDAPPTPSTLDVKGMFDFECVGGGRDYKMRCIVAENIPLTQIPEEKVYGGIIKIAGPYQREEFRQRQPLSAQERGRYVPPEVTAAYNEAYIQPYAEQLKSARAYCEINL